jgi:hypothetical protein
MTPNLQSPISSPRSLSSEGWAAIAGAASAAFLFAKKLLACKSAKPEPMGRADFYAELAALKDHMHADHLALMEKFEAVHLALLEKHDANHRELLAALDRQATRINALESGLARVDERTSKGGRTSS